MTTEQDINIAVLKGRIEALEQRIINLETRFETRLSSIDNKLEKISTELAQRRGGLAMLGAIWMVLGGAIGWVLTHIVLRQTP